MQKGNKNMEKYFVTDNERLGLQASQFVHAKLSGKYFEEAKEKFPDVKFVTVNDVYDILENTTGEGKELIFSKFSKPWKDSIKAKYPNVIISQYDEETGETLE